MNNLSDKYALILEPPCNNVDFIDIRNSPLYVSVLNFIYTYKITNILISLSGGVDSMVLTEILLDIRNNNINNETDIYLFCCHINYNNRVESISERNFLSEYCSIKDIHFDCKNIDFKRGDVKRNIYEKKTRTIRYEYYKDLCEIYGCSGVLLAHHKDDICENIFNNIMRGGREITNLKAMKTENDIMGVKVYRPMIDYHKDAILCIAHFLKIPYFLDSTPEWSCRGKMRRSIFPSCDDCYTNTYKQSLLTLGEESEELGNIINKYIVDSYISKVEYNDTGFILPIEEILYEPNILKLIMRKLCHCNGIETMKYRNVESLCDRLTEYKSDKRTERIKMTLLKNYSIVINRDVIIVSKNIL